MSLFKEQENTMSKLQKAEDDLLSFLQSQFSGLEDDLTLALVAIYVWDLSKEKYKPIFRFPLHILKQEMRTVIVLMTPKHLAPEEREEMALKHIINTMHERALATYSYQTRRQKSSQFSPSYYIYIDPNTPSVFPLPDGMDDIPDSPASPSPSNSSSSTCSIVSSGSGTLTAGSDIAPSASCVSQSETVFAADEERDEFFATEETVGDLSLYNTHNDLPDELEFPEQDDYAFLEYEDGGELEQEERDSENEDDDEEEDIDWGFPVLCTYGPEFFEKAELAVERPVTKLSVSDTDVVIGSRKRVKVQVEYHDDMTPPKQPRSHHCVAKRAERRTSFPESRRQMFKVIEM